MGLIADTNALSVVAEGQPEIILSHPVLRRDLHFDLVWFVVFVTGYTRRIVFV